jgi:hypothetical protein
VKANSVIEDEEDNDLDHQALFPPDSLLAVNN